MKVIISSKQFFDGYSDSQEEEIECEIEDRKESLLIKLKDGSIELKENIFIYERNGNKLEIGLNKVYKNIYETSEGKIKLETKGILVTKLDKTIGLVGVAKYELKFENTKSYINEVKIKIREK